MPRNPNPVGYNGNINLPLPNAQIKLTADELKEYVHCAKDPVYFIQNYVKIVQVDQGIVKFKLWDFQETIVNLLQNNRFVIAKLPRQSGKSTVIICGYFLWYVLFHTDVSVALLANKEATAIQLLDRLKQSFELLPDFLKQGVVKWDAKLIKLANNARVRAEATSASAIRGDSFNIVFLDEFAFVPENIALEFMASVYPVISSGKTTKLFIVSTPNGYNMFYKIWNDSVEGRNGYANFGCTWRDVPGRDEAWAEETRKNMGSEQKFQQEFECDFMGSANTLISPWKLAQLSYAEPIETRLDKKGNGIRIYRKPVHRKAGDDEDDQDPHVYVIVVDVGQGQEQDYSVAQVIDISENPFRQVATYRDNTIKPTQFAPVLRDIGRHYNNAFMLLEINAEGLAVADILSTELEYENIIQVYPHPKKGQMLSSGFNPRARLGLRVTEATKRIGCTGFKSLVENDRLLICDYETMREMTTFIAKMNKNNSAAKTYEAEVGNHDDCVMPLVLMGWLTLQSGFENYVGLSMRQLLTEGHDQLTTELPFVGILGDGAQPNAPIKSAGGWDVVDDPDFWKEDNASTNWLN